MTAEVVQKVAEGIIAKIHGSDDLVVGGDRPAGSFRNFQSLVRLPGSVKSPRFFLHRPRYTPSTARQGAMRPRGRRSITGFPPRVLSLEFLAGFSQTNSH